MERLIFLVGGAAPGQGVLDCVKWGKGAEACLHVSVSAFCPQMQGAQAPYVPASVTSPFPVHAFPCRLVCSECLMRATEKYRQHCAVSAALCISLPKGRTQHFLHYIHSACPLPVPILVLDLRDYSTLVQRGAPHCMDLSSSILVPRSCPLFSTISNVANNPYNHGISHKFKCDWRILISSGISGSRDLYIFNFKSLCQIARQRCLSIYHLTSN